MLSNPPHIPKSIGDPDISEVGCAFGRFQLLHNGHLEHILGAKERCTKLVVGITNPYNNQCSSLSNTTRVLRSNNPFSFDERRDMVDLVLKDRGFTQGIDYEMVPFPIETPDKIPEYVPVGTTMYISALDGKWSEEKVKILQQHGWKVVILPFIEKPNDATKIRELMRAGVQDWRNLVPLVVARYIDTKELVSRLFESKSPSD